MSWPNSRISSFFVRLSILAWCDVDSVAFRVCECQNLEVWVAFGDLLEPLVASPAGSQRVQVAVPAPENHRPLRSRRIC
jgi:hypothetical protein